MQRLPVSVSLKRASLLAALVSTVTFAACSEPQDNTPPVGSIAVTLSRTRVALGSPLEVTYKFTLAENAPPLGDRKVFVHFLDADDELMWTDDHEPVPPTTQWKAGQTVEYTRTMFVPNYPYVGLTKVIAGLYAIDKNERVKLSGEDRGDRSYPVAQLELLPQTENVFVIFKDGWHATEVANSDRAVEWQWTKKEATIAFRNPRKDSILYLKVDNPGLKAGTQQELGIWNATDLLGTISVNKEDSQVQRFPLPAARLGTADMVELRLVPDHTFVPALEPGANSGDQRELGVRVFNLFVQPS
jgi:hypothetical protein